MLQNVALNFLLPSTFYISGTTSTPRHLMIIEKIFYINSLCYHGCRLELFILFSAFCNSNSDCTAGVTVCKETVDGGSKTCQIEASCKSLCSAGQFCDAANLCQYGNFNNQHFISL